MSSDILFLAHRLPWPPDRGDRIRSWHMLKALTAERPVHVAALVDCAEDASEAQVAQVNAVAATLSTAVRTKPRAVAVAESLITGVPASVAAFSSRRLREAVNVRLRGGGIDTIFAFSGQMAQYVPRDWRGRFVMDFVDVDSAKFAQLGETTRGLAGIALRREARRLLAFETATARRADAALFVSQAEAALFESRTGIAAQVVENGVDAVHFAPGTVEPAMAASPLIVFTGQMDYVPNVAAVVGFVRDVLPMLPGATFAIVGRAPTAAVAALAGANVIVTGAVADTRPWIAAAAVIVAPLALARGVQNKVLEAMAMARPVVASPGAATGIDARDGVELIVADGAAAQATAIAALIADPARAAAIGAAARARVVKRYSWDACLAPLAALVSP